ncbi:MAG: LuxR C-terminal-related transcriptional regulator [Gammaproteobacteria bacterium]|nr:LuxR C-terminal-related transcriptional regulator [Gammaproteobacteria bacterium]
MISSGIHVAEERIQKILGGTSETVNKACHELYKKTPIKYFGYYVFYDNGLTSAYVSDPGLTLILLEKKLTPSLYDLNMASRLGMKSLILSHHVPFPESMSATNREKYKEIISHAADRRSYHALIYIDRFPTYFRYCIFAVDKSDTSVFNFYLNSYTYLQDFITYFENSAYELMEDEKESKKILVPSYLDSIDIDNGLLESAEIESEFDFLLPNTSSMTHILDSLTNRESECLSLLAKGYTMKNAAKRLGISHRTVEQHLRNVKDKFGLNTKNQLVELWHDHRVKGES